MKAILRVTRATESVVKHLYNSRDGVWGLAIARELELLTGTVYPILGRLETLGWVESRWEEDYSRSGPRRKYYKLTTDGLTAAETLISSTKQTAISRSVRKHA